MSHFSLLSLQIIYKRLQVAPVKCAAKYDFRVTTYQAKGCIIFFYNDRRNYRSRSRGPAKHGDYLSDLASFILKPILYHEICGPRLRSASIWLWAYVSPLNPGIFQVPDGNFSRRSLATSIHLLIKGGQLQLHYTIVRRISFDQSRPAIQ